jgi:hypothetical protein
MSEVAQHTMEPRLVPLVETVLRRSTSPPRLSNEVDARTVTTVSVTAGVES